MSFQRLLRFAPALLGPALGLGAAVGLSGCRGLPFKEPPRHLISDMDWQPKYHAEGESLFFPDGRAQRPIIEGTVARGSFHDDDPVYTGKVAGTQTNLVRSPIPVTKELVERGQDRFNIYCAPCHDRTGSGKGMVALRGYQPPPSNLTEDRIRNMPDGEIYQAITKGVRNMPSYAYQIPVEDRWAIVTWVRVLARSQHAAIADVPDANKGAIEAEIGGGAK